jgi:hypothetical protein
MASSSARTSSLTSVAGTIYLPQRQSVAHQWHRARRAHPALPRLETRLRRLPAASEVLSHCRRPLILRQVRSGSRRSASGAFDPKPKSPPEALGSKATLKPEAIVMRSRRESFG